MCQPLLKCLRRAAFIAAAFLPAIAYARATEAPDVLQLELAPPGDSGERKFESEHGPLPKREYWLNLSPTDRVKGFLLQPDGSSRDLPVLKQDMGSLVSFDSPWKSESMHGPNNVYVFDESVIGDTLHIRTAKWIVIHHNCSWGHPYKYNEKRLTPVGLKQIPLEIVPEPLWDGNLHVNTQTGKTLTLRVLSYGEPAADARLTVITDEGWQKELRADAAGEVRVQLIRDYYPDTWDSFHRTHLGGLLFVAHLEKPGTGALNGRAYRRQLLSTSLPWRYRPAEADYMSLAWGLGIGFATMALSAAAVFLYRERRRKPFQRARFHE